MGFATPSATILPAGVLVSPIVIPTHTVSLAGSQFDSFAELPRSTPTDTIPNFQSFPNQLTVNPAGGADFTSLSAALADSSVQAQDTFIAVESGSDTTQPIEPPAKTSNVWTVIGPSNHASLPAVGTRVTPSDATNMFRLHCPISGSSWNPCWRPQAGARKYWLFGADIDVESGGGTLNGGRMIELDEGSNGTGSNQADQAQEVFIDRCYIHSVVDGTRNTPRAISLNSGESGVLNCYFEDISSGTQQNWIIGGWFGQGPYLIQNNFFGGGSCIIGGADPPADDMFPRDITFKNNHVYRPPSHSSNPNVLVVNSLEFKVGERVLIENNYFENNWADAQTGKMILFRCTNQGGSGGPSDPGNTVFLADVTFRFNVMDDTPNCIDCAAWGSQFRQALQPVQNVSIHDNVGFNIASEATVTGGTEYATFLQSEGIDWHVFNNTFDNNSSDGPIQLNGSGASNMLLQNNIMYVGNFGVKGGGCTQGTDCLNQWADGVQGYDFDGNVVFGANVGQYPALSNVYPSNDSGVFVDAANHDYNLTASPGFGNGTNGRARGADVTALYGSDPYNPSAGSRLEGVRSTVLPS